MKHWLCSVDGNFSMLQTTPHLIKLGCLLGFQLDSIDLLTSFLEIRNTAGGKNNSWGTCRMNSNTLCITLYSGSSGKYELYLCSRKGSHLFLCWVSQCELQITTTSLPCSPLCLLDLHAWIHLS